MESIHVIIADRSQLVRLGLTGILYRTGLSLTIREVSEPDKFIHSLQKEHNGLLITSRSFVSACSTEAVKYVQNNRHRFYNVIIEDIECGPYNDIPCNERIYLNDSERTIYRKLQKYMQQLSDHGDQDRAGEEISQREKDVLKLVALGMTNKEIAEKLFISSHTVISHRKNITAKLGIKTIAGLTVYALINKLISAEDIK